MVEASGQGPSPRPNSPALRDSIPHGISDQSKTKYRNVTINGLSHSRFAGGPVTINGYVTERR
jgi:hypothetical protein